MSVMESYTETKAQFNYFPEDHRPRLNTCACTTVHLVNADSLLPSNFHDYFFKNFCLGLLRQNEDFGI